MATDSTEVLKSETAPISDRPQRWSASVALIAGLASLSCCVLPLLLFVIGASGAWVGTLTSLAPYQGYFIGGAVAAIGFGFWRVYGPSSRVCRPGSACGTPLSRRLTRIGLWAAVFFVLTALLFNLYGAEILGV